MKEDKKNDIKKSIEHLQKELEELKERNPDGNYEQYEYMINQLYTLLNGEFPKGLWRKLIIKMLFSMLILLCLTIILVGAVFGFTHSLFNSIPPVHLLFIIPSISLILVILMRIDIMILNYTNIGYIKGIVISSIASITLLAFADTAWVHLCMNLDRSFMLATILWLSFMGLDIWIQRKIFL